MENLCGASAKMVLSCLNALDILTRLPRHLSVPDEANVQVDKRVCSALLGNSKVVEPLLRFCLEHAEDKPHTDLQYIVAGKAVIMFGTWKNAGAKPLHVKVNRAWDGFRRVSFLISI